MPKYDYETFIGPDKFVYGPQGNQTVYNVGGLGIMVIIANGLFATTMIMAMQRYEFSPIAAIVIGALYYASTTTVALLILSGALAQIATNRQEQKTLRHYHDLQYSIERIRSPQLPSVDPLQLPGAEPAERLPGPLGGRTYVPAEELTTVRDAIAWAEGLYQITDGKPDPGKVHLRTKERPGRLRVKAPAANMRVWLESKKVLENAPNGVRLRVERYPDVQTLRSILNG